MSALAIDREPGSELTSEQRMAVTLVKSVLQAADDAGEVSAAQLIPLTALRQLATLLPLVATSDATASDRVIVAEYLKEIAAGMRQFGAVA